MVEKPKEPIRNPSRPKKPKPHLSGTEKATPESDKEKELVGVSVDFLIPVK